MFANAELIRNVRSQLRPTKMVTTLVISAALSLVLAVSLNHITMPASGAHAWALQFLHLLFWLQALILGVGGGIACVNAIYREKEQTTFDYQRVTRLSPLELALGKLFGAPVFMYFLCLCAAPLTIFAAVKARQNFTFVLAAYAALLVGSIAFQALCLLISLLAVRGSHTSAIILVLVILAAHSSVPRALSYYFQLGSLSPFYSTRVAVQQSWSIYLPESLGEYVYVNESANVGDAFFGHAVNHFPVMLILNAALLAWVLLALARNIKRDPDQYELYTPWESLGIVAFVNLVLLGFVNWNSGHALDLQAVLLSVNGVILGTLALAQLRNRDRTRRILRAQTGEISSWLNLTWLAPFLFIAALGAGVLVSVCADIARKSTAEWSTALSMFRTLFFVAWIVRDAQFLQWMMLRRGKRPLLMGVVFLAVFYAAASILLTAFGMFDAEKLPFTAIFLPTPIYYLDLAAWILRPAIWVAAFVAQWLLAALFITLQRNTIQELAHHPAPEAVVPAAAN